MTHSPLDASVLITTYKQLRSTCLALKALFAQQTGFTYEVIVCDDGSDEATVRAYRELLQAAPVPARLSWQQDRGFRLAANRNNGIRLARGRIVALLDGDMVPEANFVEMHVQAHEHDRVIAVGNRLWRNSENLPARLDDVQSLWEYLRSEESTDRFSRFNEATEMLYRHYLSKKHPWTNCYGCNISVTRSPLVEFDEAFEDWGNEDYDLSYGLTTLHGYEVRTTDAVAYEVEGRDKDWKQGDYVAHLRSGVRFFDKWEATGLRPQYAIPRYELDPETGHWGATRLPVHGLDFGDYPEYVAMVRRWLTENGLYPGRDVEPAQE